MTEKQMLKQILRNQVYLAALVHAAARQTTTSVDFNFNKLKEETQALIGPLDQGSLRWDGSIR
jgi:hypothetical protein